MLPPVEWVDAPPAQASSAPNQYDWRLLVGYLMAHPGKWALIDADDISASVVATRLQKLGVECAVRRRRLYVRFPVKVGGAS